MIGVKVSAQNMGLTWPEQVLLLHLPLGRLGFSILAAVRAPMLALAFATTNMSVVPPSLL
jgi:hypothetical protein